MFFLRKWCGLISFVLLTVALAGCDSTSVPQDQEVIHLDNLTSLPEHQLETSNNFRVAVAAILSPQGNVNSYLPLMSYLENALGQPVRMVQRRTYQEINDLLARNLVDMAFVCTGAFFEGHRKKEMELLVVPRIGGKITYKAVIIVSASSKLYTLDDLRNTTFAFTDPLSNTGYLYPVALFTDKGNPPADFFSRTIFTYSHDRSIQAVHSQVADGASVDNVVLAYAKERDPALSKSLRVIWESDEFGMPPVVVPHGVPVARKEALQKILLTMSTTSQGRAVLAQLGVEEFVAPQPDLYGDHCPEKQ
jgi:phosphonate transport system substrate-binding protein